MSCAHGEKVTFTATLQRVYELRPNERDGRFTHGWKVWKRHESNPRTGIIIGWRTLRDGRRDWVDEVGAVFIPEGEPIRAALVSFSMTRNPVYVPADAIASGGAA